MAGRSRRRSSRSITERCSRSARPSARGTRPAMRPHSASWRPYPAAATRTAPPARRRDSNCSHCSR
eukprot:4109779-Prymnesium_polylepis.1